MAKYRIKEYTRENFEELARLSFNLRLRTKIFRDDLGVENRFAMKDAEDQLDLWIKNNIEKDNEQDEQG